MRGTPNASGPGRDRTRAAVVVLVVAGSLFATGAAEAGARCFGGAATIVGTRGDDLIVGTTGDDVIDGLRGFDRVRGLGGDDRICGGGGSDFVRGGGGDDVIEGAGGSDTAHGGPGADRIVLGAGAVEGLFGGPGDDRLFGGSGSFDGLIGGAGDDLLHGGRGQDLAEFFGAPNGVRADLEAGTATGQGADRLIAIEGLVGSNFDDVLLGDAISNLIVAQQGDDVVDARGSGTLEGLAADLIDGGGGDDVLDGDAGADIVTFEDAPVPVTVDLTLGTATGWGADSLSGIEAIVGSSFDDALTGDAQDNAFAAGAGDDAIDGRGGTDQAAYFDAAGSVVADLRAGVATGWGNDTLLGVEDLTGSGSADVLTGDDGPNAIVGGSGPDLLAGAAGDDLLVGARGNDRADGGDDLDTCDAETELACEVDPVPPRAPVGGSIPSWGTGARSARHEPQEGAMSRTVKAALLQTDWSGDQESMIDKHEEAAREASAQGAEVICFQELFYGPYFCQVQDTEYYSYTEPIPEGPTTKRFQSVAKELGMVMVLPMYEFVQAGQYFNTAAVIDADGSYLGKYRKQHIPQVKGFWEKFYFTPGTEGYPVFETAVGRVGVYICYDRHFPEGWRILGLHGAEIVFNPSATHRGLSEYIWRLEQPAAAVANMYYVGAINRVGIEPLGENDFYGQSYFVDPEGQFVGEVGDAYKPELIVRELDLDKIRDVRDRWAFYRDRRPDAYDPIVAR